MKFNTRLTELALVTMLTEAFAANDGVTANLAGSKPMTLLTPLPLNCASV